MKNITLALAIALGFCATEAEAQTSTRQRRSLLGGRNRPAEVALFDAKQAMPYSDAVEKAKENDPEAYYWLSYYFADGKTVNVDGKVAWKFLLKSEELGYPEASRTMGRVHEFYSLKEGRNSYSEFSFTVDYTGCKQFESSSLTNEIATASIESLYEKAFKGGVIDATNDLMRLQKKIDEAQARIEKAKEARRKAEEEKYMRDENTARALALLPPENPKEEVQPKAGKAAAEEKARIAEERERAHAQREAEKEAERAEREKEREETQKKLAEMAEELKRQREAAEQSKFEVLIAGGDENQKLKQLEEDTSNARVIFEKMLALEEKSKTLSADALEIYKDRLDVLSREYEVSSNRLARAQSMLTPEKIAEAERRKKAEEEEKARKQKAEAEYNAFAADIEAEIATEKEAQRKAKAAAEMREAERELERVREAERAQRKKEREETQKKLAEMAAELRKQREAAEKKGE